MDELSDGWTPEERGMVDARSRKVQRCARSLTAQRLAITKENPCPRISGGSASPGQLSLLCNLIFILSLTFAYISSPGVLLSFLAGSGTSLLSSLILAALIHIACTGGFI